MVQEDPNKVFTVQWKSVHNVKISSDSVECNIIAIYVLQDRQLLAVDSWNKKIKLLDEQYQVVSHLYEPAYPQFMCPITPSEVAVTVDDDRYTHEVQFITVNNAQLLMGRKLQLQHICYGIVCHYEDLYITSHTALYKYTLRGKQVSKMYEDKSALLTVCNCAVSPTGDKLYITNNSHEMLLTLARDGSVLATFSDPALGIPRGVHVTPAGQVLVFAWSGTILQLDIEGRRKLASLATRDDGVVKPWSVCYNRHTSSIMVGLEKKSSILVLKVE